jgi:hypothetical protein
MSARILIVLLLIGCDSPREQVRKERAVEWVEPCRDKTVLLATTAGSPNQFECGNREHVMRVQVASTPSNEEAAAVVFCECQRRATK